MIITPWEAAAQEFELSPAERYLYRPVEWAVDCIDWGDTEGLTAYQNKGLAALIEHQRVALRGPHGLGKTTEAAITVWWFATTRNAAKLDWKIITTASAWRHLQVFLWPEIRKWARLIKWDVLGRGPVDARRELLDLHIKFQYGAASAVASNDAAKIEGAHADSLLYIVDEAKTVPTETWDAIEGAFSGAGVPGQLPEAYALALSTPGAPVGRFYDIHRRSPGLEDWHPIHVTLADAIAAGRITPQWAEQRKRQWGADSAMYHIRVLGEFHSDDTSALIPLSWVEAANERWHTWVDAGRPPLEGRRVLGVDIARSGADETIFAHRIGGAVTHLEPVATMDTMVATERVKAAVALGDITAVVDSAGVGGGVVDRLRQLKVKPIAYTGASKTSARDRTREFGFVNTRSAAYWHVRELLDPAFGSEVMLPPSDELTADLTTPLWDITSGTPAKIRVETKEDVVKRLGRSPDRGDAVVMAFWAEKLRTPAKVAPPPTGARMPVSTASPLGRR